MSIASENYVLVERPENGVALITLNRPDRLNALTREMVDHLNQILDELAADETCRVLIVTGAGRGFCSGQDVAAANARSQAGASGVIEKLHWQEQFAGMGARLRRAPQAVIAAINGPAVGAGMAIALSCDVRIVSPTARFLVGAVRIGLSGGESGLSYLLPRMIGASRAFDILLTGRAVDADEAVANGLALRMAAQEDLTSSAFEYACQIISNAPFAIRNTKRLMWDNLDANSYEAAIAHENRAQILATMTRDYQEALAAFTEKRPPSFEGR